MKAYIGYVKGTKNGVVGVLNITDNKGVTLHTSKKVLTEGVERFKTDLMTLKWGVLQISSLMRNAVIPNEPVTIFIGNKTVYDWLYKQTAPMSFIDIIGDIYLELSFMSSESEIILSSLIDKKLKIALSKFERERKGVKATELFKDIKETE